MEIGDRFGKLTVIDFDGRYAICKCECGNIKSIKKTSLTIKNALQGLVDVFKNK